MSAFCSALYLVFLFFTHSYTTFCHKKHQIILWIYNVTHFSLNLVGAAACTYMGLLKVQLLCRQWDDTDEKIVQVKQEQCPVGLSLKACETISHIILHNQYHSYLFPYNRIIFLTCPSKQQVFSAVPFEGAEGGGTRANADRCWRPIIHNHLKAFQVGFSVLIF